MANAQRVQGSRDSFIKIRDKLIPNLKTCEYNEINPTIEEIVKETKNQVRQKDKLGYEFYYKVILYTDRMKLENQGTEYYKRLNYLLREITKTYKW